MICPNCGKENADNVQVCVSCGQNLAAQTPLVQSGSQAYPSQGQQQAPAQVVPPQNPPLDNQGANTEFPLELNKFNWGAFLLTWIWGIGHGVWIALIALVSGFIPFIGVIFGLGFAIYLGIKGNELAWKTGKYNDIEKFKVTEKKWTLAGIILFFVGLFLIIPILLLIVIGATHDAKGKADDAKRKADITRIQFSLEDCYNPDTKAYPVNLNDECITSKFDNGAVPKDPAAGTVYEYKTSGTPPKSYTLTATMENKTETPSGTYILESRQ